MTDEELELLGAKYGSVTSLTSFDDWPPDFVRDYQVIGALIARLRNLEDHVYKDPN